MRKILVNKPNGEQAIIRVSHGGGYNDTAKILWDELADGELPAITLGKMRRVNDGLVTDPDYLPEHAAAIAAAAVPSVVTMRQARLALLDASLLTAVKTFIAAQPEESQIYWESSQEIHRTHPLVATVQAALTLTDTDIDNLFIAAAQKV